MRMTRYAASLAVLGLALAGCASEAGNQAAEQTDAGVEVEQSTDFEPGTTMAELSEAGSITVGTKFDQPGFGLLNPTTDAPDGFDVEIAKIIAAELGIAPEGIEWVETVSANREPFLQNGQVDMVVATYTINDQRKELIDFAGPYYTAGQDIMVPTGNPQGIQGPEDLAGKRVCSVEGSTPAQNIRDNYPEAQLTLFDVYSKCADALANGQVDAVTTDNVILTGLVAGSDGGFELVGNPFTEEPYGIGVPKGDDEFRTFINDTLEQAYESGAWADAWDRTAGAITGEPAPEPPSVDRY
ncbi:glutamate ABC transporter substrate-binding protein [Geodermatophilus sp. YIM 151500]|uniref:glutamate ABC transporter substrate-binding protein n=1 Tax=Geodermatophilus sp. YIM 151500 TaxID=2984531 RepID=UPI0021E45FFB|nr:glutamate ABC transporter substrate-binding protein [Geodermatophilus sp. YIM 151500]MCV2488399.1 glutamate ABC transporter substrate-binding protein [Geodermatophilus sp. YIM 151500]